MRVIKLTFWSGNMIIVLAKGIPEAVVKVKIYYKKEMGRDMPDTKTVEDIGGIDGWAFERLKDD